MRLVPGSGGFSRILVTCNRCASRIHVSHAYADVQDWPGTWYCYSCIAPHLDEPPAPLYECSKCDRTDYHSHEMTIYLVLEREGRETDVVAAFVNEQEAIAYANKQEAEAGLLLLKSIQLQLD